MLSVDNNKDIVFDMNEALSFDGHTGPYIQNAYVRANSHPEEGQRRSSDPPRPISTTTWTPHEIELIEQSHAFPALVQQAANEYRPLVIATYVYDLANCLPQFLSCGARPADGDLQSVTPACDWWRRPSRCWPMPALWTLGAGSHVGITAVVM